MKNLTISFLLIIFLANTSFGQNEISFDLNCLITPLQIKETPLKMDRTFCNNGVMTVDSFDYLAKDFYHQDDVSLSSSYHNFFDSDGMIQAKFGEILIQEESLFNNPVAKVIDMTEAEIVIKIPNWKNVNIVAFDIEDLSNEGILFLAKFHGVPKLYDSVSDIMEVNDSIEISMVGNRVFIQGDIDGFHIGGDRIKVGNIVFNEQLPVSTTNPASENSNLEIYPNPVQDVLNIICKSSVIKNVHIFDTQGKNILNITQPKFPHYVNMENWNTGIYIAEIELENGERFYQKVVKR